KPPPYEAPPPYTPRAPAYGGGRYYGGGAARPFVSGARSPLGFAPFLFLPLVALAFFPGPWLHGAYLYHAAPYHPNKTEAAVAHPDSDNAANDNPEGVPVTCICQEKSQCGCEKNDNATYIDSVLKDKDADGMPRNTSLVRVATVNGTQGIWINGTVGAEDEGKSGEKNAAAAGQVQRLRLAKGLGYALIVAVVSSMALTV
ncbi:hypothetical protein KEM52_004224, partial [Ascosphaera acerosa]